MFKKSKYPILVTTIISCVIIIASLFVLGFKGVNLGVSLGGGTQFEVVLSNTDNAALVTEAVNIVLDEHKLSIDSTFVQDKFVASDDKGDFSRKSLVVQSAKKVSEDEMKAIKNEIATQVGVSVDKVSVETITSAFSSKDVLGLAILFGVIAASVFVFGWVRYDIFAAISFVVTLLHNVILFFATVILTRLQLTLASIAALIVLSLFMIVVLINIYEKFREISKQPDSFKINASKRMIQGEMEVVTPYLLVIIAILVFTLCLVFLPIPRIIFVAINIILALVISAYSLLLIGPSTYVALVEISEMRLKAVLSRNDTVNKAIKKKIKKNQQANQNKSDK